MEHDVDAGADVHKLALVKRVPRSLPGIAFDVVNGLRSALDQAGYSVAKAAGATGAHAHFPFGGTEAQARAKARGRSKHIPKEVFELMMAFKPYEGGDDLLMALNKLTNTPKHERILEIEPLVAGLDAYLTSMTMVGPYQWPPLWDRAKNEMVIARVPHGTRPNMNFQIGALVEFAQIPTLQGQPADAVLGAMAVKVESVVSAVEGETRRLGLIP
jgi:hypothetical protein